MNVKEFPIEEEYRKDTGVTPADVAVLRAWLRTQPHLPEEYITDLDIILAYHSCDGSVEVAKQLLDLNCTLRTTFTSYFKDRRFDSTVENTFKKQLYAPLAARSRDGNAVLYTQAIDTDPEHFDFTNCLKAFFMIIDIWQYETGTWPGLEVVVNLQGYGLGHMAKLDIRNLQQFLCYIQEAIPFKLKKLHLLYAPSFVDRIIAIMKPFMKVDMLNIVEVHSDGFNSVAERIPLAAFPEDVGGAYKTVQQLNDEVLEKLRASASFLETENRKRAEESLRPAAARAVVDAFGGLSGSFKKLDID